MGEPVLEATGVRRRFDGACALDGVSLEVDRGELVVLMGPNGAGKSVLLSCLAGSRVPDEGSVRVHDGRDPTDRIARRRSSVLLQGQMLDPNLTGRQNVSFYRALHPRFDDRWRDLVGRLDLADALDRPVGEYSGGMERKLELAIALGADVPLYLLDEPTAELDLSAMQTVRALLAERTDRGRAVVLASHAPFDAEVADRIVLLSDGRVVAAGPPDGLLAAVPDVVRSRDGTLPPSIPAERVFDDGSERRGFLPTGAEGAPLPDDERQAAAGYEVRSPTYTDLFNYYAHVVPGRPTADRRPRNRAQAEVSDGDRDRTTGR